jgi:hypothetical protein
MSAINSLNADKLSLGYARDEPILVMPDYGTRIIDFHRVQGFLFKPDFFAGCLDPRRLGGGVRVP